MARSSSSPKSSEASRRSTPTSKGGKGVTATTAASPTTTNGGFIDMPNLPTNLFKALVILVVGAMQGWLLGLAGMFSPYTFRSQMYFDTFILMKIFISGVGSSMIVQSLLFDTMLPDTWNVVRSYRRVSLGYGRVVIGCLMIGAGMAICGSGPTMIGVQLGMKMGSAIYIFAGFLAGAGLFQAMEGVVFHFPPVCWKGDKEKTVVEDYFNDGVITVDRDGKLTAEAKKKTGKKLLRYRDIALPAGIMMMVMAVGLEYAFPHTTDLRKIGLGALVGSTPSPFSYIYPTIAGGFIGINQISTRLIMFDGQGGSRSLVNIVSTLTNGVIGGRFKIDSFAKSWQLLHVYGATLIGGVIALKMMDAYMAANSTAKSGYAAAHLMVEKSPAIGGAMMPTADHTAFTSFTDVTAATGFTPFVSFLGAAIVGFGGRYAGGCTCGHGVSGSSELCVQSLCGAGAIFGGGILTAVLFGLRAPQFE